MFCPFCSIDNLERQRKSSESFECECGFFRFEVSEKINKRSVKIKRADFRVGDKLFSSIFMSHNEQRIYKSENLKWNRVYPDDIDLFIQNIINLETLKRVMDV